MHTDTNTFYRCKYFFNDTHREKLQKQFNTKTKNLRRLNLDSDVTTLKPGQVCFQDFCALHWRKMKKNHYNCHNTSLKVDFDLSMKYEQENEF